jgi:RNA polymerase sigma factor (sigma-70 family)
MTSSVAARPPKELGRSEAAALVLAAAEGDQPSWDALVAEYGHAIWAIARSHRLTAAEAADVSQTTWLRLLENIDRLRDPGSVGAWLATTARREAAHQQARIRAIVPVDDVRLAGIEEMTTDEIDTALLRRETAATVHQALRQLPNRPRTLLSMLMQDDPLTYEQIAKVLNVPVGSVGPTRARALQRLRRIIESAAEAGAPSVGW